MLYEDVIIHVFIGLNQAKMCRLTDLFYNAGPVCHVNSWQTVFLPAFMCFLRKWEVFPASNGLFTSFYLFYHSAFTWQVFTTTPFLRPSAKWCRSSSLSSPLWRTSLTSSFLWVKSRTNFVTDSVIYVWPPVWVTSSHIMVSNLHFRYN